MTVAASVGFATMGLVPFFGKKGLFQPVPIIGRTARFVKPAISAAGGTRRRAAELLLTSTFDLPIIFHLIVSASAVVPQSINPFLMHRFPGLFIAVLFMGWKFTKGGRS